jgi:1-acyl-sn-glycerol-3-phosphate acyltransferase
MISLGVLARATMETTRISVPTIVDAVLGRTNYTVCDRRLDSWSRNLLLQAGIELDIVGRDNVAPATTYVVMSNHQSHYDIPVVFQSLGIRVRMIAKTELFKIPIMGRAMLDSGFIELDRSNRRLALLSMRKAKTRILHDQLSVWIAPEGTRSKDGRIGEFKTGGFYLALDAQVPIVPVTIDGTIGVLRSGDTRVHRGQTVKVVIHPPIETKEYTRARLQELIGQVRESILSGFEDPQAHDLALPTAD